MPAVAIFVVRDQGEVVGGEPVVPGNAIGSIW